MKPRPAANGVPAGDYSARGLGLPSTSFAGFAQDAYGGVTSWRGSYGTTGGYQAYTR